METAEYILELLMYNPLIVYSWGFSSPVAVDNGLQFRVRGFKHCGLVEVSFDAHAEQFQILLFSNEGAVSEVKNGVTMSGLVEAIDEMVEKVPDYEQRVRQTYGLCSIK